MTIVRDVIAKRLVIPAIIARKAAVKPSTTAVITFPTAVNAPTTKPIINPLSLEKEWKWWYLR